MVKGLLKGESNSDETIHERGRKKVFTIRSDFWRIIIQVSAEKVVQ